MPCEGRSLGPHTCKCWPCNGLPIFLAPRGQGQGSKLASQLSGTGKLWFQVKNQTSRWRVIKVDPQCPSLSSSYMCMTLCKYIRTHTHPNIQTHTTHIKKKELVEYPPGAKLLHVVYKPCGTWLLLTSGLVTFPLCLLSFDSPKA